MTGMSLNLLGAHASAWRLPHVLPLPLPWPLASAAVGVVCAAAGVYAVPAEPERHEMDRALLRAGVAAAAACAWALWRDEVAATLLPFVAATLLLGELRLRAAARQASSSSSSSPSRGSSR